MSDDTKSDAASSAKRNAIQGLKSAMNEMGGHSLIGALNSAKEAPAEEKTEANEEASESNYDGLSREELIKLLNK